MKSTILKTRTRVGTGSREKRKKMTFHWKAQKIFLELLASWHRAL